MLTWVSYTLHQVACVGLWAAITLCITRLPGALLVACMRREQPRSRMCLVKVIRRICSIDAHGFHRCPCPAFRPAVKHVSKHSLSRTRDDLDALRSVPVAFCYLGQGCTMLEAAMRATCMLRV
jgi:hypothetical protein